jgi:hypothetical protein
MGLALLFLLTSAVLMSASPAEVPVFEITTGESTIKFDVEASVAIVDKFDKVGRQANVHVARTFDRRFGH